MAPAFLEFWNVVPHPPQNRRVHKDHSALSHHFHEVTCTQLVPQIPAHAQNDNLLVELPPLELESQPFPPVPCSKPPNLPPLPIPPHHLLQSHGLSSDRILVVMSNRAPLLKVFSRAIVRGIWFLSERLPRSRAENNANLLGNLSRREGEVDPQTARWPPGAVIFSFALKLNTSQQITFQKKLEFTSITLVVCSHGT
jgi:hypothetical protein